jgi:hypothetical protein
MAVSVITEKKLTGNKQVFVTYSKKSWIINSIQNDNGSVEVKNVDRSEYRLITKIKLKKSHIISSVPFSLLKMEGVSFSAFKLPWLAVKRQNSEKNLEQIGNKEFANHLINSLCNDILAELDRADTKYNTITCAYILEQQEIYNYPVKKIDISSYYDFFLKYQVRGFFHYYNFQSSLQPKSISDIANLQYLIYLDSLDLDIKDGKASVTFIILAPNVLYDILDFLLWNKNNDYKKKNRQYFDTKLTITSNPYDFRHARASKTVNGQKSRKVTLVKNGVLLHLPLDRERSKHIKQKYIPNAFDCLELQGGNTPIKEMIKNSDDTLFIYDLRGEIGDDGSYSGIIKNGFIIRKGEFTKRLINTHIFFNIFELFTKLETVSSELVSMGSCIFPYIKCHIGGDT